MEVVLYSCGMCLTGESNKVHFFLHLQNAIKLSCSVGDCGCLPIVMNLTGLLKAKLIEFGLEKLPI